MPPMAWNGRPLARNGRPAGSSSCCCGGTSDTCGCSGISTSDTLVCDISSTDCDGLDGISFDLTHNGSYWVGGPTQGYCISGYVYVKCEGQADGTFAGDCTDYQIRNALSESACGTSPQTWEYADTCQCTPSFELTLDVTVTETIPGFCTCCDSYPGSITLTITKKP